MNPDDPQAAHRIVADYARVLEQGDPQAFPASVRALPYPKQTIKSAILTCATALRETRQLTDEMREFLEQAYVALADYLDEDLVRVMAEYRESLAAVADVQAARDKVHTPAWQRIAETSRLAGEIAKSIAEDTAVLRLEFRAGVGGATV
jgi:dsDNA-binding SOS-regulon protein